MADIQLRTGPAGKGSPLTLEQVDANFTNLNIEVGQKLDITEFTASNILTKLMTVASTDMVGLNSTTLTGLVPSVSTPSSTDKTSVVARDSDGTIYATQVIASGVTPQLEPGAFFGDLSGDVYGSVFGNADTATAIQTPILINGVSFDGTSDITVYDSTKLSLTGGQLTGYVTLHAVPTQTMHAATKGYVDTYGCPQGAIIMWYGSVIPTGWGLCDGTVQSGIQTPDLRGRFVYGASGVGGGGDVGDTGGNVNKATDTAGSHAHTGSTGSHALTLAEIPSHAHSLSNVLNVQSGGGQARHEAFNSNSSVVTATGSAGGGLGHSHVIGSDGSHTHNISNILPPYIKLAYIMKLV